VRSDHTVILTAIDSAKAYPDALRRVSYLDVETRKRSSFSRITSPCRHLLSPRSTSAAGRSNSSSSGSSSTCGSRLLWHQRERSEDAIWIAVSVYVWWPFVRKRLGLEASLYQILQILSVTLFEKTPILRALQASDFENELANPGNQLILFDF